MTDLVDRLQRPLHNQRGTASIEYSLIILAVVVAAAVAANTLAKQYGGPLNAAADAVAAARAALSGAP